MPLFSDDEIREHTFTAVFERGQQLFKLKRVVDLSYIGEDIIASVRDEKSEKVVISREGRKLQFKCTCRSPHAGACEHAVATMFAANTDSAIQIGFDWNELPARSSDGQTQTLHKTQTTANDQPDTVTATQKRLEIIELPPEKPIMRLYLSEQEGMLLVEVRFAYCRGTVEFARSDTAVSRVVPTREGEVVRITRSRARESGLCSVLSSFELNPYRTGFYTPTVNPRIWTLQQLPQLAAEGYEIYGQERLQSTQARKTEPKLRLSVSSGDSCIDCTLHIAFDGIPATLAALIAAIRQKSRFVLLSDGSSGVLPQKWLDTFSALFFAFDKEPKGNTIRLRNEQIGIPELLCELAEECTGDIFFTRIRERLPAFKGVSTQQIPKGFQAQLRPYQQAGFEWFYFLKEFHFGGCLADDMGLGKTVQTLALLYKEKVLGEGQPSLVVVPNSLLFNWQRESQKFSPQLNVLIYHGATRKNYRSILHMADVVLTTYGTIIRDVQMLQQHMFHYIILDEAQAIKNPTSQISKCVRSLKSSHRLSLSGTPIENNLSELWSLFTFLNPGMLGSYRMFLQNFIKPIEREMNETTMETLKKLVFPFILRRTKSQVAKELPPKNEIVVYTEMVQHQRTLYDVTKELYSGRIKESIDRVGMDASRMQMLEGLLRLRQICCHPQLYNDKYAEDSGKFQLAEEMVQDAVSEGHRVLIFSQFVSALELFRKRIACFGIHSELLTGATRDRQKVVDRFQSDRGDPVFLISLKAGGTGLNLTAADYVFHLDPWWNPSAENQASDRAYRIGQTKPVFVYKMITRNSIEERVLELQQRKQQLMNGIIQTERSFFKSLSKDDVLELFE